MNWRQVHHVESHGSDAGQICGGGRQGAVHGASVRSNATGGTREQLVPRAIQCAGAVHPDAVLGAPGEQITQREFVEQPERLHGQRVLKTCARIVVGAQCVRGIQQRLAPLAWHAGGRPLEQSRTDLEIVGQFGGTLAGFQLGGDVVAPGSDRIAPPVDPEGPQSLAVRHEVRVKPVERPARLHRDMHRLDACRVLVPVTRGRYAAQRSLGELGVAGSQASHHQGCGDGVMAFAPDGRRHRHNLADDGLGRIASTRDHGGDIVDAYASGHHVHRSRRAPAARDSSGYRTLCDTPARGGNMGYVTATTRRVGGELPQGMRSPEISVRF
ncbi:Uncharacterised protein [Mycobacteroides abscessus subsp. abscessus]|nr:Uncharacterised protein [Mycobacteroides abscessus subsp. abscessus]